MRKAAVGIVAVAAMIGTPIFAADMAVKTPPLAPAPVPTWTGFYGGIEFGVGWSDQAVNYSPNDPIAECLLNGTCGIPGEHPAPNGYRISQSGVVGGFEAGYNWQAGSNWLLGLETDFSFSGMDGQASPTSLIGVVPVFGPLTQSITAEQRTDWYGTVRGRAGWLATPNLLLFGTGGFAYGRVDESATYLIPGVSAVILPFSALCTNSVTATPCFTGSSSAIRTGWTAGGGAEWLLDQHWSAKIEYQFVDLGTETVRITALSICPATSCGTPVGTIPSSFNAAFRDQFHVVRVGLNYRF